jgi:hypothetical protein
MTSQINSLYINIDESYPVAGVDNDTQGFRDNFDVIKSSLAIASSEITELQDTTAKTNAANDFAGNTITNTILVTATDKSYAPGVFSEGVPQLQLRNGNHQRVVLDADDLNIVLSWKPTASLDLDNDRYGRMVVEITTAGAEDEFNVIWSSEGGGDIRYNKNYPTNFKVTIVPKVIEFTTYDGGQTVFASLLGEFTEATNDLTIENYDSLTEEIASGTVSLTKKTSQISPTLLQPNATGTLTAGVEGQIKVLVKTTTVGQMTINVAAAGWKASGGGAMLLDTIGQACTLQYTGNKWYCVGNNGVEFS